VLSLKTTLLTSPAVWVTAAIFISASSSEFDKTWRGMLKREVCGVIEKGVWNVFDQPPFTFLYNWNITALAVDPQQPAVVFPQFCQLN
jgi:hypothetical protein